MKKAKFVYIIFILIIMVTLFGCTSNPGEKVTQYNFKQGVSELKLKLLENTPPDQIYPNSNFKLVLELDNQAAYDVTNGVIKMVGINDKYFFIYPLDQQFDTLIGRSSTNPVGDKIYLEFDGTSIDLFQNSERYVNNYFIKAKYDTKLEFSDTVCINPNLYEVYDAGCKVESTKTYSGQGGPLAVNKMEEIVLPGGASEVQFRLYLTNNGRGKIKKITMGNVRLGGEMMDCKFQDSLLNQKQIELKSDKQEAVITCKRKFIKDYKSYSTVLTADFAYSYELKQMQRLNLIK